MNRTSRVVVALVAPIATMEVAPTREAEPAMAVSPDGAYLYVVSEP